MNVAVITGPPGAGKSAVLTALMGLLEADDVRFAAVEAEALALGHPGPDHEVAFDHLAYLAESFRSRGYPTLVLTATIEDAEYLQRLRDALPVDDMLLVRLAAPTALLRARITRREPADWGGLPRLLHAADALATAIAALPGVDLVLDTADADPRTVAASVRDALQARG